MFYEEEGNKHKLGSWEANKEQTSVYKHVVSVVSLSCYEKGPVRHFLNSRDDELYCFAVDKERLEFGHFAVASWRNSKRFENNMHASFNKQH